MAQYHPTHILVVGFPIEGTPRHNQILGQVFEAAAPFASRIVVSVEVEWLNDESPSVIQSLDENFSKATDNDATTYESEPSAEALQTLQSLLEMSGGHRVFGVRKVELKCDDETCLRYVPEHENLTLDGQQLGELATTVQGAIADDPAVVLPKQSLVQWKYTGTRYSISPPSLCEGNVCHDLSRLSSIESHAEEITIDLHWHESDRGAIGQAVGWVSSRIGISRPNTLHFESTQEFTAAREALEKVLSGTGEQQL